MAGLEVLFTGVQARLRGREDAIVCCLHWSIVQQGLKCIGVGDQMPADAGSCKKSELLPADWNASEDVFTLLYIQPNTKHVCLLKVIKMDNTLLVHFMRLNDEAMSDMMVDVALYASGDNSTYDSAYNDPEGLQEKFTKEVLNPVLKASPTGTSSSSTRSTDRPRSSDQRTALEDDDPLRVPPRRPYGTRQPEWEPPDGPFAVGRGDLDPFSAGVGGGMMFDPMRSGRPHRGIDPSAGLPGRLPPGAVPPGARFDPFGPDLDGSGNPQGGGRAGPDPDHLPPPGFDDMFM